MAIQTAPNTSFGARLTNSKLSPISASPGGVDGDSDSTMEDSPSVNLRPNLTPKIVSLSARLSENPTISSPFSWKDISNPSLHSISMNRAKISLPPVSPRASPHTPLEGFFPPDPSGLSISGRAEHARNTNKGTIIPATPTGPREYFSNFSNRPSLNLAVVDGSNLDISLTSRFEKVDLIGSGSSHRYSVSRNHLRHRRSTRSIPCLQVVPHRGDLCRRRSGQSRGHVTLILETKIANAKSRRSTSSKH